MKDTDARTKIIALKYEVSKLGIHIEVREGQIDRLSKKVNALLEYLELEYVTQTKQEIIRKKKKD